jgi:hypothetical protein
VSETRLRSCDLLIFVEEAAEPVTSSDARGVVLKTFWERA